MSDIAFIQRSRVGRSVFLLRTDCLEVATQSFGIKSGSSHPLCAISPEYQIVAQRLWILILAPLGAALLAGGLALWIVHQRFLPADLAAFPALLGVLCGVASIRGVPRVELFLFFDHWHRPVFYVVRERSQMQESETFVAALVQRIEDQDRGTIHREPDPPPTSSVRLPSVTSPELLGPEKTRWLFSNLAGLVSAGFPLIAPAAWSDFTFMVVLGSTAAGLLFGALSFIARERLRWFSLAGIALSLVAPLYY